MAAYTTIDNPELYFQTKLYTGTGSSLAITLDGDEDMSPNLVWIKVRSNGTYGHTVYDSVRGVNKAISSSSIGKIILVKFAMAGVSLAQINSPSPKPIINGACLLATTKEVGAPDHKTAKA